MKKFQPVVLSVRDTRISFEEHRHIYYIDGVEANGSVTTMLGKIFPPFLRTTIATNCAKSQLSHLFELQLNSKIMLIYATWEYASLLGTTVHNNIEQMIRIFQKYQITDGDARRHFMDKLLEGFKPDVNFTYMQNKKLDFWELLMVKQLNANRNLEPTDDELQVMRQHIDYHFYVDRFNADVWGRMRGFQKFWDDYYHLNYICPEYMVFDEDRKLCGTIDMLCSETTEDVHQNLYILDWKTNKSMDRALDKYKCQLHIYGRILENKYNVKVKKFSIVHFTHNDYKMYHDSIYHTCCCKQIYDDLINKT